MTFADWLLAFWVKYKGEFGIVISWLFGLGAGFNTVQSVKLHRRKVRARDLSVLEVWILSFVISGHVTALTAFVLFHVEPLEALTHGYLVGIMNTLLIIIALSAIRRWLPALHQRLRVDAFRAGDITQELDCREGRNGTDD